MLAILPGLKNIHFMPKSPNSSSNSASKPIANPSTVAAKSATRKSDSGQSKLATPQDVNGLITDQSTEKMAQVQSLVASIPFNANKAGEYGQGNSLQPVEGIHEEPESSLATGSTLTESNVSDKVGTNAQPGVNAAIESLDRVRVDSSGQCLTTNMGMPIADNQNSLKLGLRGPALLEDFILREKITHFDHERIPERIVHARGSGAHGFFESYEDLSDLTQAAPFREAGKVTPVFVRFSTVAGERGSKDTARDVRGFAVKFYTDEGNWDIVGNNMPVFFIQDAIKFPDLVHAVKPEPHNQMPQAASAHDTFWDFVSLMPESTHMLMWQMSDRAIPRSYATMQGFGVHTFRLVNAQGKSVYVKFHWNPIAGTHSLLWEEAVKISGADPDFHRRDLWERIESGAYPEYELGIQTFTEDQAEQFSFDILDSTKLIPEELIPVRPIGRMVLNRNPDNFFAETEQVAFGTQNVVPGIDFSNDPLLAGRHHSYFDTQLSRLGGPNFHEIPINSPIASVHTNQRDGIHRQAIPRGRVSYEPNSLAGGCPFQAGAGQGFMTLAARIENRAAPASQDLVRGKPEKFADHYTQATLFFESQSPAEQAHIANAFRFELSKVTVPAIRERTVSMLRNASQTLAEKVALGLGMAQLPTAMPKALENPAAPEIMVSPSLSLLARPGDGSIKGRKVAILVAPGLEIESLAAVQAALVEAGAVASLVGIRIGPVAAISAGQGKKGTSTDANEALQADASMENSPGFLFDALVLPDGAQAVQTLLQDAHTLEFVRDQYWHCKPILVLGASAAILEKAEFMPTLRDGTIDTSLLVAGEPAQLAKATEDFITAIGQHRNFARENPPSAG